MPKKWRHSMVHRLDDEALTVLVEAS